MVQKGFLSEEDIMVNKPWYIPPKKMNIYPYFF